MNKPFQSFWMAGFEGADHINARQDRLDMVGSSGHVASLDEHYAALKAMGITTVRESIGWRITRPTLAHENDFTQLRLRAQAAKRHGIQITWTFMHYGTPEGVSLLEPDFVDHFVAYAEEAAAVIAEYDPAPVINLINEISFLSWAVSQTDYVFPYAGKNEGARSQSAELGYQIKCRLVKAVLAAMPRVRAVCPKARFLHVEPLIHMVAPLDRPELADLAAEVRGYQWQTWDLLKGDMEPQLGGHEEALDLMGVNYYYNGQLEVVTDRHLDWETPDPRRLPFSALLQEVWQRYRRPLIISETGHIDDTRAKWLDEIFSESAKAIEAGVPLQGICIYPVIDRSCWHDPSKIINCGLLGHAGSIEVLTTWQKRMSPLIESQQK